MKAISLWQPWATLIAIGAKSIETRGWSTTYRGPLLIHAAKRNEHAKLGRWGSLCAVDAFAAAGLGMDLSACPRGALVATCTLADCVPVSTLKPKTPELLFGDYSEGRFAWVLKDVRPLARAVPYRGAQGFFTVPRDVLDGTGAPAEAAPVKGDSQADLFA